MYSLLLWLLNLTCALSRVDSDTLHKVPEPNTVITPEGFGH